MKPFGMRTRDERPVRRRGAGHWAYRAARLVLVVYISVLAYFAYIQTSLIFPGRDTKGQPWASVRAPQGTDLVELRTASGETVAALFGPALSEGKPRADAPERPTVVFFYGNAECLEQARAVLFDGMRNLGANVLMADYVGFGMSSGEAGEAGCYETADAAYAYLLTRPDVDAHRIVAAGWSLGAAVAVDLAARRPVAGLATFSAFTSMADMGREVFPWIPGLGLVLRHRFESEDKMARVACPVLICHGTADSIIPFRMSDRLVRAATAAPSATLVPVERADHNNLFDAGGPRVFGPFAAFLDGLPPRAA